MTRRRLATLAWIGTMLLFGPARGGAPLSEVLARTPGLVDAGQLTKRLLVQLKYASADNFMKRNVYGKLDRCYLQKAAADKLARAAAALARLRPNLRILAYDCVRPVRVQRVMWKMVRGTKYQIYVANPKNRSMHNYGCAVDLTLASAGGVPLDMGTPYDHAGRLAQPRLERAMVLSGKLTRKQWANRLLLRQVMVEAGFIPLAIEWWHFDCERREVVRKRYRAVP